MLIQHFEEDGKGAFFIKNDGDFLAEMTYYLDSPQRMVIDHTQVDDSLQGKNIGISLVEKGVEYARANQFKIVPQCPYVKKVFERDHQYDDVWR